MKKIFSLILILTFIFSLASCGQGSNTGDPTTCVHKDYNGDKYYCDLCGVIYICPDHVDKDENGACDTCAAPYECPGHADANYDGKCDRCGAPFVCPGHKDANGVGRCDICNAKFVCNHVDSDGNYKCDKCSSYFDCPTHKDYDADGFCDFCLGALTCGPTSHRDVDANCVCDICGDPYACIGYMDANTDGECDSCGASEIAHNQSGDPNTIVAFMRAYANSAPTKSVTEAVRLVGRGEYSYTLTTTASLMAGSIGGKPAAIYEETAQQLRTVEDGAGSTIEGVIETTELKREFIEGKGIRETVDGKIGGWNPRGVSFVPTKGSVALSITAETIKDVVFSTSGSNYVMEFKVTKGNCAKVFGTTDGNANVDATSDVTVVLVSNGTTITSVTISYSVAPSGDIPSQTVVIGTKYDYSVQIFSIN